MQAAYMNIEVTEENKCLEHWNTYMLKKDFRYLTERNNLTKEHSSLILFDELNDMTKKYDEYPIISTISEIILIRKAGNDSFTFPALSIVYA